MTDNTMTECPACKVECFAWRTHCPRCNIPLPHARPEVLSYDEMVTLVRQVVSAGSMRAWCKQHGFTVGYVSEMSRGMRPLTPRIAEVLGYRMETRFLLRGVPHENRD